MASQENSVSARRGFTLLELLVVMLIVVVTIAILYPVVASVREKGRQAVCLSHVSQHARAVLMYAQDYDERLPLAWNRTAARTPEDETLYPHWWNVLQPYVPNTEVFRCPDDTGYQGMRPGDPHNDQPFYPEFGSSYQSLVGWLPATDTSPSSLPRQPGGLGGMALASVFDPSRTVLTYDSWPYWHGGSPDDDPDADTARVNASYLDGSARRSSSRYVSTYLAQGPAAADGSRNLALGDLPQIKPDAPPVVTAAREGGSTGTPNIRTRARSRVAASPRSKKTPSLDGPRPGASNGEVRTANESNPPTQAPAKSSPFGGN